MERRRHTARASVPGDRAGEGSTQPRRERLPAGPGRAARVAAVAALVFTVVAVAKPWAWAIRPAAPPADDRALVHHDAARAAPLPVLRPAAAAAVAPISGDAICNVPSGWRFVADEHGAGQTTRTWLVAAAAGGARGPTDRSIPVAAFESAAIDRLGFCAPGGTAAGWQGTLWRIGPAVSSDGAAGPPQASVVARFLVPPGRLGELALPPEPGEAYWPAGEYVLEATLGLGTSAWLAVRVSRGPSSG